jgi:hypothetical protein
VCLSALSPRDHVDENDIVDVSVCRGDESVEVGMGAVLKTLEKNE